MIVIIIIYNIIIIGWYGTTDGTLKDCKLQASPDTGTTSSYCIVN